MAKFFYRAKPRQFNYRPLYYDAEGERRAQRRDELLGKKPEDGEYQPGEIIRGGGMRAKARIIEDPGSRHSAKRGQTMRLLVILAILIAIVVILFV